MASVTFKLANSQCGGVMHVGSKLGRVKVPSAESQRSTSFKRRSTWNLRNPSHDAFQLHAKRNASQHATTSAIYDMPSGDTQHNDNDMVFYELKLIHANCLLTIGKNLLIRFQNGKEAKVEYASHQSTSETNEALGNSSTPCLFLQSTSEPPCMLAFPHPEYIVNLFLDEEKLNQVLTTEFTKENQDFKYTGLWLTRGENGEFKFTFKLRLKKSKMGHQFESSLLGLQLALLHDIPIYVHRDILDEDGLQFSTTTSEMEGFNEAFKLLVVDMRQRIAEEEHRLLDAEFWRTIGRCCDIDTIVLGPWIGFK